MNLICRNIFAFVIAIIPLTVLSQTGAEPEVHEEWRLEKDGDGVQVYVRWKDNGNGIKSRELRVEMNLQSSISAVVSVLKDDRQALNWINRAEAYYSFDIRDNRHWHSYTEFNVPWPLNNQDLVADNSLVQDKASKSVYINIRNDPQKIPAKKNIDRMPHFEGSWDIIPRESGEVLVTYKIFTGQKPWLPRWIVDPIVQYGLWKTLVDLRTIILDQNRLEVRLDYIEE